MSLSLDPELFSFQSSAGNNVFYGSPSPPSIEVPDFDSADWQDVSGIVKQTLSALFTLIKHQQTVISTSKQHCRCTRKDDGALRFSGTNNTKATPTYTSENYNAAETEGGGAIAVIENRINRLDTKLQGVDAAFGGVESRINLQISDIYATLRLKLDSVILEELMRHIVTKTQMNEQIEHQLHHNLSNSSKHRLSTLNGCDSSVLLMIDNRVERKLLMMLGADDGVKEGENISSYQSSDSISLPSTLFAMIDDHTNTKMETLRQDCHAHARSLVSAVVDQVAEMQKEIKVFTFSTPPHASFGHNEENDPNAPSFSFDAWKTLLASAMSTITRDFDEKLFHLSQDLLHVNTAVRSVHHRPKHIDQYCGGRWTWDSGTLKPGMWIPWNLQLHNSHPQLLRWEPESMALKVMDAGFYELTFALFCARNLAVKPTVQVFVDGKAVMSAIHSPSYVVHHHGQQQKAKSSTEITSATTGTSLLDFLNLSARSRVSLMFQGIPDATGFIGLRKL